MANISCDRTNCISNNNGECKQTLDIKINKDGLCTSFNINETNNIFNSISYWKAEYVRDRECDCWGHYDIHTEYKCPKCGRLSKEEEIKCPYCGNKNIEYPNIERVFQKQKS